MFSCDWEGLRVCGFNDWMLYIMVFVSYWKWYVWLFDVMVMRSISSRVFSILRYEVVRWCLLWVGLWLVWWMVVEMLVWILLGMVIWLLLFVEVVVGEGVCFDVVDDENGVSIWCIDVILCMKNSVVRVVNVSIVCSDLGELGCSDCCI